MHHIVFFFFTNVTRNKAKVFSTSFKTFNGHNWEQHEEGRKEREQHEEDKEERLSRNYHEYMSQLDFAVQMEREGPQTTFSRLI
jgi:hypothetical protein